MKCDAVEAKLYEWLDGELGRAEAGLVEKHLAACPACAAALREIETIREALKAPVALPEPTEKRLWSRVENKSTGFNRFSWRQLLLASRTWLRDLDRTVFWSRVSALPLTMAGIMVMLALFPRAPIDQWSYSVYATQARNSKSAPTPVMVQIVQPQSEFNGVMDTVWRIPYEDSLWVVARIQKDGSAEIGDVIDAPRNPDLLEAVDRTLRQSTFDVAGNITNPFVIYSFHKFDVYEARVF